MTVLFRRSFEVRILAGVDGSALPWHAEGLLVEVRRGLGTLRWSAGPAPPGESCRTLVLGGTPLLVSRGDADGCPTCERLLALGMGRENADPALLERLRSASQPIDLPLRAAVEPLAPLLQLLQDGVYLLSRVPHYPTNGEGLPFWSLSRRARLLRASCDRYFDGHGVAGGYPAFLLPTQSLGRCDRERVDEYRARIRSGRGVGGLALWDGDGFLSALLDGHHRATAALLEGVPLACLTVMRTGVLEIRGRDRALVLWDARVPLRDLSRRAVRHLERGARPEPPPGTGAAAAPPSTAEGDEATITDSRWDDLRLASRRFPGVIALAARDVVGDTTDERIERLFAGSERHVPDLSLILEALIGSHDPRAVSLALRLGRSSWPDLQEHACRYLRTVRTPEVEQFFIDLLVADDDRRPWLRKHADAYFAEAGR